MPPKQEEKKIWLNTIVKFFHARRHHVHQCACGTSFPDVAALSPADETTGDGADSVQVYNPLHYPFQIIFVSMICGVSYCRRISIM